MRCRDIRNMERAWEEINQYKFGLANYKDAKGEHGRKNMWAEFSAHVWSRQYGEWWSMRSDLGENHMAQIYAM